MADTPELDANLDDAELEALRRAVAEADAAAEAGRVVSHDRVRPWLLGLAQGRRAPRPKPE
jgi:predicted transcriptional regulator